MTDRAVCIRPRTIRARAERRADGISMQFGDFLNEADGRPLFVTTEFEAGVLRIRPVGPCVGQREAPIMTEQVTGVMKQHEDSLRVIVVDLSDVQMLCSMGLGAIIDMRNRAAALGARAILTGMSKEIQDLVKLVRIERLYKIARTPAEVEKLAA